MELKKLIELYEDEMIAEGAWRGHAYASDYLHDIRRKLIEEFERISKRYSYKDGYFYKGNKMCLSTTEMHIYDYAKHGKFVLSTDYADLIDKIYKSKMDTEDKYAIADSLDDAFKEKLAQAIGDAEDIIAQEQKGE